MKAIHSVAAGGPETLEWTEAPDPVAGPGEILVRVEACAINYPDVLIIEDQYQFRPPRPFAPGCELAGIVEAVGSGVAGWSQGDRLIATVGHGGLAEKAIVQPEAAFRLPEGRTFVQGAALLLTYATTIHALVDRGRLEAGERLLVLGAAGGVGLAAIEIGKALGATVIAAVSSEEKAVAARAAGADRTLVYGRPPFDKAQSRALADAFKRAVGGAGADVIYDPVGGDYAEPALRSINWDGRYLVVGFPAGIPKMPLNLVLLKGCDICGIFWGEFAKRNPAANRAHVDTLMRWWEGGLIAPKVSQCWPLERAGEAISAMANRQAIGKLVVTVTSGTEAPHA